MRPSSTPLLLPLLLVSASCANAVDTADALVDQATAADAPLIGVAGSGDFADRRCQIVLRELGRVVSGTGFAVQGSVWIFNAHVDVSQAALSEGFAPFLLERAGSDPGWRALAPIASVAIDANTTRFVFEIVDGNLPGPGMSATGLTRNRVRAIPFLQSTNGATRVFDHNRIVDDFATYELGLESNFAVAPDSAVCSSLAAGITFGATGNGTASGPLTDNGDVVVHYDLGRLPSCRATHNGYPGWTITAFARFLPGGATAEAQVVAHHQGRSESQPASFHLPAGTTRLELWFKNTDVNGCEAWDSQRGANHAFAVTAADAAERPDWVGNVGVVISRGAAWACDGAAPFGSEVTFGTWARARAVATSICFEVWEPGVTDVDNADIWRDLDVQVHARNDPAAPFTASWVNLAGRHGNNAVYAVDLRALDPFRPSQCSTAPTTTFYQGSEAFLRAEVELYMSVNGVELRPTGEPVFRVRYEDYASSPRACP